MARKKKLSLARILIIILGGYFIFTWFGGTNQKRGTNSNNSRKELSPATSHTTSSSYALLPTRNTWPPVAGQDGKAYTDASRLLTANYYVMLDASGSMADHKCAGNSSKMQVAALALDKFAQSLPADANFGFAIFNGTIIKELFPLGTERKNIRQITDSILPAASTPLASAVRFSYNKIVEQGQRQLGYGEYYLVLITDGIADKGQEADKDIRKILEQSPVQVYTIGFCINEHHSLNQPGLTVYRSANNPQSLEQGLQEVLAESPDFNISDFKAEQ